MSKPIRSGQASRIRAERAIPGRAPGARLLVGAAMVALGAAALLGTARGAASIETSASGAGRPGATVGGGMRHGATAGVATPRLQDWHQPLDATSPIGAFIADGQGVPGYRAGDKELARWALQAWEGAADGGFRLRQAPQGAARVHLYWASGQGGLYGEMRPFLLDGKRGAAVFVLPDTSGLGAEIAGRAERDELFRDVVVYLTCLHELGHAFGLTHTDQFDDIMYSFQNGGDIPYYFQRYRDRISTRADIQHESGLSEHDVERLQKLYPKP